MNRGTRTGKARSNDGYRSLNHGDGASKHGLLPPGIVGSNNFILVSRGAVSAGNNQRTARNDYKKAQRKDGNDSKLQLQLHL